MKLILILFLFYSSFTENYYVKLENNEKHTKYVMVKYENNKGDWVTKEVKIKPKGHYGFFIHNKTFYVFSVYHLSGGKVIYSVRGDDGVGFMKEIGYGRTAHYKKFDVTEPKGLFKKTNLEI